ncbi:hypothetical protein JM18_003170 [Phytophthora kernoviae]|uniref:ubiquitinyl hydrolase 1 n=1 Tax=Phytophthora kernoviae TaxID=325452 RepID=A0A921V9X8_9STRA|nr:hypothetical protein JM18_003170 [Phytophthora kernoviae]
MVVWGSAAFLGMFGDPYLRGTPYEAGGDPQALLGALSGFVKILQPQQTPSTEDEPNPVTFPLTVDQERVLQDTLLPQLAFCGQWTEKGAQVEDAKQFQSFLQEWKTVLTQLEVGKPTLVPGGYVGNTSTHTIIYVVEKTSEDGEYSFTVCNKGPGAELYHPCRVEGGAEKIRVQSCIQISAIPTNRFLDMAFWTLLFSLWVRKPPSEYHRVETIYDVLLPWLAGDKLLPLASEMTQQHTPTDWTNAALGGVHTSQRSQLGFCKSVVEAVRYLCLRSGVFTIDEVEYAILYKMRYSLFQQVVRDLEIAENPAKAIPKATLEKALQTLSTISLQDALQGTHTVSTIDPDAVVGIYFALSTSHTCRKFTRTLAALSEKLHAANKKLVIIVVSVDKEQAEYTALVEKLPSHSWLMVPFAEVEARKNLVQIFGVTKSMEQPSRQFDSERSLAALCVLCIYDALLRSPAADDPLEISHLPTYHGTLSAEESEYLMSYLTVPYTRIPLVVSFFSSRDRVTYLFNPLLQQLFRAVLFEGGDWVSDDKAEEISHIPLRKSNLVLQEEAIQRVFDAKVHHQKCEDHLGAMNGLLLNELIHAPEAIAVPLLKMLDAVKELGEASVHSADARFILFMIKLGVDELKLDAQTGEILWRNDELKPVPDSMTQYADFMAIFGNKSLHCGLVARQEHRLWVNIVGTDFQLVEWDDPTHEIDQGVGAPVVYEPGTTDSSDNPNENPQEMKMYWECPACTCANFNGDNPNATCEVCGTPRVARAPPPPSGPSSNDKPKQPGDDGFRYLGKIFSRPFDIYSEDEHPYGEEQWFVDLVGNALRLLYPPLPEDKKLPYTLFLPKDPLPNNATCVRLIGLDRGSGDKEKEKMATFKEIVAYRTMEVMHIYALVSHGRRLYRKLIFTSNSRLSLHSFPLALSSDGGPVDPALLRASGEPTERQLNGGSLIVLLATPMEIDEEMKNGEREDEALEVVEETVGETLYLLSMLEASSEHTTDLKLICPNHDLYRPAIRGEPYSSVLVSDRGSVGWQQAMETRFYTYPVHSSYTFLLPSSLSSTLYLILTSLLSRNYATAMELIMGCNVDVKFTDEEKRVFDQLAKTLDDRHPNACACRIRLSLGIAYSENKAPWKLSGELHDYLTTSGHVDASCKLTLEEETEALAHCHQRSPLLLLRKEFCDNVGVDGVTKIDFMLARSRVGGQPWMKLCLYSKNYLGAHSKKLSTVRYNRPKYGAGIDNKFLIDDEEAGKLVWNCAVVGDEVSGSNRGLGFLFLYECLNQQLVVRMGGEDCTRSFGDLFTRFLHLKLSRWGRETVDDGEEEFAPSYAMAQLAMVIAHPGDAWPSSPCDQESAHLLSRGANLYSKLTVGTLLKTFFDFGEMEFQSRLESDDHQVRVITPIKTQFSQLHHTAEHTFEITIASESETKNFDASNASCDERQFIGGQNAPINPEFPLEAIDVKRFITYCDPEAAASSTLPFDLSTHPVAQTAAAKDLLKRLGDDIAINAQAVNDSEDAFITGVTPTDLSPPGGQYPQSSRVAIEKLQELIHVCEKVRMSDRKMVEEGIAMLEALLNDIRGDIHGNAEETISADRFVMQRHVGIYPRVTFDFVTSLLASDSFEADLRARNPFVVNAAPDLVEKVQMIDSFLASLAKGSSRVQQMIMGAGKTTVLFRMGKMEVSVERIKYYLECSRIRVSDLVRIVSQLKQDFSRQLGPRDQRPACAMFREWVNTGLAAISTEKQQATGGVLPLPLFQLRDSAQVSRLHFLVAKLASVVYYYVRQHVFPSCMNFQKLKISACGHELGSNSLFAKRIGFSGTPSNLLPMDLGECYYEPRSDGSIFQALTNKRIVSIERKVEWTARSLLLDIAHAQPPMHALIDTGALITGFDNQEVAAFLLTELPTEMEGVVYLDEDDRQMILLRDHNAPMPLVQCGLSPSKRFTFYDQVHTTGMDIKQCVNARAVVTLGKDMTFRDYAQGAYRMRGITTGQSICLFLIPEVENRIRHEMKLAQVELSAQSSTQQRLDEFLLLVPAWLLINSMRMESMQLVQLSLQELHNTWRKRALHSLLDEIAASTAENKPLASRLRRFIGDEDDASKAWLRSCIALFRVEISYTVDAVVPTKKQLSDVIGKLVENHAAFVQTTEEIARVAAVKQRLAHSSGNQQHMLGEDGSEQGDLRLTAEVVHENEAEAEEEAEEEAEQEEQKMSAFTRDDEHPIPWGAAILAHPPAGAAAAATDDEEMKTAEQQQKEEETSVFYPFSKFQAHTECPPVAFPSNLLMSGNFFRRRWVGLGERRIKNVGLILEWSPLLHQEAMKTVVQQLFVTYMATTGTANTANANEVAVKALQAAAEMATANPETVSTALKDAVTNTTINMPVYLATLSLAEGETIRRMIHKKHPVFQVSQVQLRTSEGELVESSSFFSSWTSSPTVTDLDEMEPRDQSVAVGIQCLRFFNNEMYYFPKELELLLHGLATVPISLRHEFFECLLRLRRRERHLWGDTPLAKVFTAQSEWHLLAARARLQQFQQSLLRKQRQYQKKKEKGKDLKPTMAALHISVALRRFDEDEDGRLSAEEVHKCFESFQLGFSSKELNEIIGLIADARFLDGENSSGQGIPMETICAAFGISRDEMRAALQRDDQESALVAAGLDAEASWGCPVCTYVNDGAAEICGACSEPNPKHQDQDQHHQQQQQGWRCGNCTFINQPDDVCCAICELDMDGQRGVPRGKWVCAGEQGGCTFFNSMSNFYCEVCNRARPDLASTRF